MVATDSLFSDAVPFTAMQREFQYQVPGSGHYFWKVQVVGEHGVLSQWSEVRRFSVMSDVSFFPDFQSMSRISRVVSGSHGIYLLGRVGQNASVMKCDQQLFKSWQKDFTFSNSDAVDCDELDGGELYVALDDFSYPAYDPWVFLLSADGQEIWSRELNSYYKITSVRSTSDQMLVCGFISSFDSPYLVKLDTTEVTVQWALGENEGRDCRRLFDDRETGRYVALVLGSTIDNSSSTDHIYLAKTSSNGYGEDLILLDDRIILLGYQDGTVSDAALVVPVDFDGNVLFE